MKNQILPHLFGGSHDLGLMVQYLSYQKNEKSLSSLLTVDAKLDMEENWFLLQISHTTDIKFYISLISFSLIPIWLSKLFWVDPT